MKVTFLGTATSSGLPVIGCGCRVCRSTNPRNQRYRASILMEWDGYRAVVDTGPEFRLQAIRAGLSEIDAVLLTHEHADHIFGLDDVRFLCPPRGAPLPLYAEERTARSVRESFSYIFRGPEIPGTFRPSIDIRTVDGPFEVCGRSFTPVRVMHGQLPITAYRTQGFAYATDVSAIPPESEAALQGLDTLVIGALRRRPHPTHFTLEEALAAIERLAPRHAYLTHISHELEHEETSATLPSNVFLAYDGLRIEA